MHTTSVMKSLEDFNTRYKKFVLHVLLKVYIQGIHKRMVRFQK
jgi:hypothetical protein